MEDKDISVFNFDLSKAEKTIKDGITIFTLRKLNNDKIITTREGQDIKT